MSGGKLANDPSTTAGPPSSTPAAFTGSEIAAAAATRSAAALRVAMASGPPIAQAFSAAGDAAPSSRRERRDYRREAGRIGRSGELRTRDERVGRQRPSAGERLLPGGGVIEQIEKGGVERQIEANCSGTGVADRKQEPGDALPPRIRAGSARHGGRGTEVRQHHVLGGKIERCDVERRQSERGKRRRCDLDAASVQEANADPAERAKSARDECVGCRREARARRVAREPWWPRARAEGDDQPLLDPASAARSRREIRTRRAATSLG